ncbi:MAG TPA: DUF4124 domain-containing protein [Gammaproteobacteria bacterium]|nr:DUF4124 domain-containing protein [Gammaproteobacteria bacterium]
MIYALKMKRLISVLVLALAATSAAAEIYKWILPDGSVEYSDRPPVEGAKKVELRPLVTYTPSVNSAPSETTETEIAEEADGYDSFTITSPANDSAIRDNAGNVTLNFSIVPTLIEGHGIDIFVDGRKFGRSTAAVVTLSNVNRGSHQIYAAIVDDSGTEVARTGTITIHLKRASGLL